MIALPSTPSYPAGERHNYPISDMIVSGPATRQQHFA
jgi:hypothetical protein